MNRLNIQVGISDFTKLREDNCYYIDKSGLIVDLLQKSSAEVTLITRPRRFGKTLGMSMLASFFDIRRDSRALFTGLEITQHEKLCREWQNNWPVIFLSLRRVDGLNFSGAYEMLAAVIAELYKQHLYLLESSRISTFDKQAMQAILEGRATISDIKGSLLLLTQLLQEHYAKPVILLLDEYDVPLAKASANGYYQEMLDVMKGLMQVMKDNPSLQLAVITGCLKIAKESIFTGTNNFISDTIADTRLNEYFGFIQSDIDKLLADADCTEKAELIRKWYDGYRFGAFDVYCPWDVMNYLRDLQYNPAAKPASYWLNTSDNAIIRSFIDMSGTGITKKLETLLAGGYIMQRIDESLTYDYLHSSEDNLWSVLYLTGYLTRARGSEVPESLLAGRTALLIPNQEIKDIFTTTVATWFSESAKQWNREKLFASIWAGDAEAATQELNKLLRRTISYHDYKEDFYHAFLAGIFAGAGYTVDSNKEHGEGRSDVIVYDQLNGRVAVFEAKYARALEQLPAACAKALEQIDARFYAEEFKDDYDEVLCYGVAFFKKRCLLQKK